MYAMLAEHNQGLTENTQSLNALRLKKLSMHNEFSIVFFVDTVLFIKYTI